MSLSSGLIPIGGGKSNKASTLSDMAPLEALSPPKKLGGNSTNWGEDLDDLLNSLDSPPNKKSINKNKSKNKTKKSSLKNKSSKYQDEYSDDLLESSDNYVSGYNNTNNPKNKMKDTTDFDLSIASDLGPISPPSVTKTKDMLGDLISSRDLEDSILGGLVGNKKPKRNISEPISTTVPTTSTQKQQDTIINNKNKINLQNNKKASFDDNDSFDDNNDDIKVYDKMDRPSTITSKYNATDNNISQSINQPIITTKKHIEPNIQESNSFDDMDLPIFDKDPKPVIKNASSATEIKQKSNITNNDTQKISSQFNMDDSFDETSLPIFGNDNNSLLRANTRSNTAPVPETNISTSKFPSSTLSKKDSSWNDDSPQKKKESITVSVPKLSSPGSSSNIQASFNDETSNVITDINKKKNDDIDTAMPFIPSFYDPQPRSRRNLGGSRRDNKDSSMAAAGKSASLEELDKLLTTEPPVSGPATGKEFKDPFASAESNASKQAGILPRSISNMRPQQNPISKFSDSSDSENEKFNNFDIKKKKPSTVIAVSDRPSTASAAITSISKSSIVGDLIETRPITAPTEPRSPQHHTEGLTVDPDAQQFNNKASLRSLRRSPGSSSRSNLITGLTSPESQQHARFALLTDDNNQDTENTGVSTGASYPAWLGGGSSNNASASNTSTMRISTPKTPTDTRERGLDSQDNKLYKTMQQRLEQMQLEKEAVERQLRLEIDSLKNSIIYRQMSGSDNSTLLRGNSFGFGNDIHQTQEQYLQQISELQSEISRLKDELLMQTVKHKEELQAAKERSLKDLDSADVRRRDDIRLIEIRHDEAVSALKRMHAEEIATIKQRARDGLALEELSNQIRTTTGSLRFIEEHMNSQYKGLDIVKEGQFEARERVLAAAEEKARERAELAEAEGYRLKGILVHMEQMVATLRGQGAEERERLKYEHRRLEMTQQSLEAERKAHQIRMQEDIDDIRKKNSLLNENIRRQEKEFLDKKLQLDDQQCKLDNDKDLFKNHVEATLKSTEDGIRRLKEEEAKLLRSKEEIYKEAQKLKQERASAVNDLQRADELAADINNAWRKIMMEKAALEDTARRVHEASEELGLVGKEIEKRNQNLIERENELEQGLKEFEASGNILAKREYDVRQNSKVIEEKQIALRSAEEDTFFKKLSAASIHREALKQRAINSVAALSTVVKPKKTDFIDNYSMNTIAAHGIQKPVEYISNNYNSTDVFNGENRSLESELRDLQRVIRSSKFKTSKNASERMTTFNFLSNEVDFVNKISSGGYM